MTTLSLLIAYCVLILLASLVGGWVPLMVRLTHIRMQVATSFVAGLMLGVGVVHLLPHAWHQLNSIDRCAAWLIAGFLAMFLIQRFFHFHQHDVIDESVEGAAEVDHDHAAHAHDDAHRHARPRAQPSARPLAWTGAALGLTLHTLIDGFAVAASVQAESHAGGREQLAGLSTLLVVILHKPFDAMAISTLMSASGWSRAACHRVNALFALAIPLGMLAFYFGQVLFSGATAMFLGSALAFVAGSFLCIAASDLLPELQFHTHDRVKLTVALLVGLAVALAVGRFEVSGHDAHASVTPLEVHSHRSSRSPAAELASQANGPAARSGGAA